MCLAGGFGVRRLGCDLGLGDVSPHSKDALAVAEDLHAGGVELCNFNTRELFWQQQFITCAAPACLVFGQHLAVEQIADIAQGGIL